MKWTHTHPPQHHSLSLPLSLLQHQEQIRTQKHIYHILISVFFSFLRTNNSKTRDPKLDLSLGLFSDPQMHPMYACC